MGKNGLCFAVLGQARESSYINAIAFFEAYIRGFAFMLLRHAFSLQQVLRWDP